MKNRRGDRGFVNNGSKGQQRPGFANNGLPGHKGDVGAYGSHGPMGPKVSSARGYDVKPGSKGIGGSNVVKR